jgi:hypothetical protein
MQQRAPLKSEWYLLKYKTDWCSNFDVDPETELNLKDYQVIENLEKSWQQYKTKFVIKLSPYYGDIHDNNKNNSSFAS